MSPVRQRILQRTAATLSFLPVGSDGELSGAGPGTVTVTVTRADGTALYTDAATSGATTAARTYALTAVDTASLDVLTATWKVAGVTVGVSSHDVVGGYFYTIREARVGEPSLSDPTDNDLPFMLSVRDEVETAFESWTNMAWVPRFTVVDQPSGSTVFGPFALRSIRFARDYSNQTDFTEMSAGDLALLAFTDYGVISRYTWYGRAVYGVEHGQDAPPADLKNAAIRYHRYVANRARKGTPSRAETMVLPEGGSIGFRKAGTEWSPTGIEEVDEVLRRPAHDFRVCGIG